MLGSNIAGNGVAAPCATAQRQRWRHLEVVKVSDATLRRWCIDENTAGFHCLIVLLDLLGLIDINVQRRGVTIAAIGNQTLGLGKSVVKVLSAIHTKNG